MAECLESILGNDYGEDRFEVLVVDGRSDDRTREILSACAERHPSIRVLDNPKRITPAALNVGIRAAKGEIIMRMDAHVVYPRNYISQLVAALAETGADNVGGLIVTLPADDTPTAKAVAVGLSHPFGVGPSYCRIGSAQRRWVDSVPFGCYRRAVFEWIGMFDEDLVRNQDDEFNHRLLKHGGRCLLLPEVRLYYYPRSSLPKLARMYYQYGYFKPLVAKKLRRVMTVRQLVPAMFILALGAMAILSAWSSAAALLFGAIVATYAALVVACSAHAAGTRGAKCGLALAAVFPVVHFSYGLGYLVGIVDHFLGSGQPSQHAAAVPLSR
jgi:glycosyltransferase involved in cell wall biosynthesis